MKTISIGFIKIFIEAAVDDRKTKWMLIIKIRNYEKNPAFLV